MIILENTSSEKLHFPHIGTFESRGSLSVSEADAEVLLRNKSLRRVDNTKVKGVSRDRSMKGIETE